MLEILLQALTTFFVTIDPVALAPIFASLTQHDDDAGRHRIALRATFIAGCVLLAFAVGGEVMLAVLGISLPALRIAGGVLLFLLAIEMVFARQSGIRSTTAGEKAEASAREDVAIFPIAVPLIAGPAAITAVILMMGHAGPSLVIKGGVLVTLVVALAATYAILIVAARLFALLGVTGINVVSRVLGILLAALATQFIVDGIKASGLIAGAG